MGDGRTTTSRTTAGRRSRARRARLQRRRQQAGRLFHSKGDRGRDARATTERKTGQRGSERNVPFYQTNPPFLPAFFCVSIMLSVTYVVCRAGLQVGSFSKTKPPVGCF